MKNTASFMVKQEGFRGATLDEVVAEVLSAYKNAFKNLKLQGEIEKNSVDGKDARKLTYTCEISKM